MPEDIDWRSLADPASTTAIYMPGKTLVTLVAKAIEEGLAPQTPALAIARATRPDQAVISSSVVDLPARLAERNLPGPLLVIIGRSLAADVRQAGFTDARRTATT
jgi:uroporphyrin-III C-methyltransferase/precorrin-2 dehydrogenase/sirohydrochlorin ferrochelatase